MRTFLLTAATLGALSAAARAQCPDGTPLPCAGAPVRRSTVAVLPFENRSRDTADAYLPHTVVTNLFDQRSYQEFGGSVIGRRALVGMTTDF